MELQLSSQDYAFATSLVQFVLGRYVGRSVSLKQYPHPSTVRSITSAFGSSIDKYLTIHGDYIAREYLQYFPEADSITNDVFCERMDYFQRAVREEVVSTVGDLIQFSNFITKLSVLGYSNNVTDAPYKAIDVVRRNVCDFIHKHSIREDVFWTSVEDAAQAIPLEGEESRALLQSLRSYYLSKIEDSE